MIDLSLHRPEPLLRHHARPVDASTPPRVGAERLRAGDSLLVTDRYTTGEQILAQLDFLMPPPPPGASYQVRHNHWRTHRDTSLRLLAPVRMNRLDLQDARPIGLLDELYPDCPTFVLPFVQIQELHGAWNRYVEGVHLAVLGHKLHPYYGTYVPTRVTHLELFGTWLSQYPGPRNRAIDVGTGCGVLALMLARAGFGRVLATDISPNALESVARDLRRLNPPPPVDLMCADLLEEVKSPVDLIVFNPPWMRGEIEGHLDEALFFQDPDLFRRFFEQSAARLNPQGRVVVLFSNIMELVQPAEPHPILRELERGQLRLIQKLHRRVKPTPGPNGELRKTRERVEVWELGKV